MLTETTEPCSMRILFPSLCVSPYVNTHALMFVVSAEPTVYWNAEYCNWLHYKTPSTDLLCVQLKKSAIYHIHYQMHTVMLYERRCVGFC